MCSTALSAFWEAVKQQPPDLNLAMGSGASASRGGKAADDFCLEQFRSTRNVYEKLMSGTTTLSDDAILRALKAHVADAAVTALPREKRRRSSVVDSAVQQMNLQAAGAGGTISDGKRPPSALLRFQIRSYSPSCAFSAVAFE